MEHIFRRIICLFRGHKWKIDYELTGSTSFAIGRCAYCKDTRLLSYMETRRLKYGACPVCGRPYANEFKRCAYGHGWRKNDESDI